LGHFLPFQPATTGRAKALFPNSGDSMLSNTAGFKVMLLTAVALAASACGKSENAGTDTTAGTSDTTGLGAASTVNPAWTDANIFALLDEANVADSTHGALASTKGTSSAVREYGRQMMRDHHTLRAEGEALAKRLNITPAPPTGDTLPAHAQRVSDMLGTTAKGNDFDKAYIDHEVEMHKSVLDIATRAMTAAQSTELKNMIQKAAPAIQAHLDKAQSIQKTMK
jgi:putative membrane protein